MIDIHSHVLFGLDDGARTLEDSLAMLRMAAEHGTTAIVATPHANLQYRYEPELIAERRAQLSEAMDGAIRDPFRLRFPPKLREHPGRHRKSAQIHH